MLPISTTVVIPQNDIDPYRLQVMSWTKQKIVQSICDGLPAEMLKDRAVIVNNPLNKVEQLLSTQDRVMPLPPKYG